MVTKDAGIGMRAYDRLLTDFKGIIETLLTCMAHIYHDAEAVHFLDYLFAKLRNAIMRIAATGRVAYIVIAIMAKSHIYYTPIRKMPQFIKAVLNGKTILNAEHDALLTYLLIGIEICGCSCYAKIVRYSGNSRFYDVKYGICAGGWRNRQPSLWEGLVRLYCGLL